jgi:hypothetical protein
MDDPALAEVIRSLYSAGLLCSHPKTRMQPSTWQPRYSERLPSEARTKAARNVLVRNWRPQSAARSLALSASSNNKTKRNTVYAHSHCHRPPRRDEAADIRKYARTNVAGDPPSCARSVSPSFAEAFDAYSSSTRPSGASALRLALARRSIPFQAKGYAGHTVCIPHLHEPSKASNLTTAQVAPPSWQGKDLFPDREDGSPVPPSAVHLSLHERTCSDRRCA